VDRWPGVQLFRITLYADAPQRRARVSAAQLNVTPRRTRTHPYAAN
jgi:hypothetical protein